MTVVTSYFFNCWTSWPLAFTSILNYFLSIAAFLGNALILIVHHMASKLSLRCFSTTDLCVGLTSEPLTVVYWMSEVNEHWNICHIVLPAGLLNGSILCSVSLLTLTAISVDRPLALLLKLAYRQVVTLKRTHMIVTNIYALSAVFPLRNAQHWLESSYQHTGGSSVFFYTNNISPLRYHPNQVQDHVQQSKKTT